MSLQDYVRQGLGAAMKRLAELNAKLEYVTTELEALKKRPRSLMEEIEGIEGRRIAYGLIGTQDFTIAQNGLRGATISMNVSQDGAFVWTHSPIVTWKVTQPANATLFGFWRPVWAGWPLPAQSVSAAAGTDFNEDLIAISYEMADTGGQRQYQNLPRPPAFSMPGNLVPLPTPVLITPNTTMQFIPTYERIAFNASDVPATGGQLVVELPGIRIVNL